ncbi:oocyte zinc finger protein XlCOF6-like isoform X1 [Danaus plexippus]|uniref:oocyte zinc finger protein XlCOF6-like isoform X1 n=1 Tax=Danaus plexippus TaxID=13037 RepID=UPI002AB2BBDC|nr:oocyte zinc finger protein XlCOF6-like isoform X1 [Danaus plexippus]
MYIITRKGPLYDPGLCRCCGAIKKCRLLNVEYEWQGRKEIYSDLFVDCFGLLLSHLDGEAKERLICATCVSRLREASTFRQQVLQCEEILLRTKIQSEGDSDLDCVKIEAEIKTECLMTSNEDTNDHNDVIDDIKPENKKRKSVRQKLKKRRKEDDRDVREEDLYNSRRISERLKELVNVDLAEKSTQAHNGYKLDNSTPYANIVTIVENSYACPFETSFSDYFCVYCRHLFTDPNKLREHTLNHDPLTFKEVLSNSANNKKVQIDMFRIDCRLCPQVINDFETLRDHLNSSHQIKLNLVSNEFLKFRLTSGSIACTECGTSFSFFHALKKHMAEHFGTCICDVCGAHYFEERMLVLHQKTHQKNEECFTCKECGKNFKSKYSRYIHIARLHKKEAAYQCSKCDEVFFSYSLRYRHMIDVHGEERTFQCEQCDRAYDSRKSLREHNRRFHLKILKHQCELCDKRFYLPSRLKEHMASHTGERNFRCEYCGKSYPRLRGLKVHMQSHSSDKKFKCVMCEASFTQNVNLKNHIKRQHQSLELDDYND